MNHHLWRWMQDKDELLRDNVFARRHRDCRIVFENRCIAVHARKKFGGASN